MPQKSGVARMALRLAIFLVPILAGWGVLEWWMARVPTSHSVKRQNLENLQDKIDTLILGSSSAYWDIAPQDLPGTAYNLANVAQSLYFDDRIATQVLPHLPNLRRVIIAIPYISMFYQLHGTAEEERQFYYFQEWGIPPPRWRERLDIRMVSRVALQTPQFAASSFVKAVLQRARGGAFAPEPLEQPIDERGWSPRERGDPSELSGPVVERKLAYHHDMMHFSEEAANLAALDHMISELRARNVELVIVTPPVWKEYRARIRSDYWQHAQADFAQLTRKYGVRYFNFLSAPGFEPEDFMDADHLDKRGAERFTRMLREALYESALTNNAEYSHERR